MAISRYPGIRSFERYEQALFHGRSKESRELYSLIKVKRSVVLFAKSGIGKTSMLNAGVIPLLEKEQYHAVKARFQDTTNTPVQIITKVIQPYINPVRLQKFAGPKPSLWELLKACDFKQNHEPAIPIFIFDQFEEFFAHSAQAQSEFTEAIADIINERVPRKIRKQLRDIPRKQRTLEQLDWHSPIDMKIVFSIRSDRLSFLDNLSEDIPLILNSRYHLKPLQLRQAEEAIRKPAELDGGKLGIEFQTQPFKYTQGMIDYILNALKNKNNEIESFQLQILCQHIESKVAAEQKAQKSTK